MTVINHKSISGITSITTAAGSDNVLTVHTNNQTERLRIASDGKVGIGSEIPQATLDVYGNNSSAGGLIQVTQDGTGDAAIDFQLKGTREYSLGIDNSDSDKFKLSGSAGLNNNTLLTVTNAGKVGVGTDNPGSLLDVYKTSNDTKIKVRTTTAGAWIEADSANSGYHGIILSSNGTEKWFSGSYASHNFHIKDGSASGGAERFTIVDGTGNIGINETTPEELLDLGENNQQNLKFGQRGYLGQAYSTSATILGHSVKAKTTGTTASGMIVTETNSGGGAPSAIRQVSGTIQFHTAASGTADADFDSERLRITSDGVLSWRSGLASALSGTGNPYSLNIYRDSGSGYGYLDCLTGSTNHTGWKMRAYHNGSYRNVIAHSTSDYTWFETGGSERLKINSYGQIITGGGSGISHNNVGNSAFGSFLEINGTHTIDHHGVLGISGKTNTNNNRVGLVQFLNTENSNSSSNGSANSRSLAHISVYADTSDNNAGDDCGGRIVIGTKGEAAAMNDLLFLTSDKTVGIQAIPAVGDMSSTSTGGAALSDPKLYVYDGGTNGKYNLMIRCNGGSDADNTGSAIALNHSNDRGILIEGGRWSGNRSWGAIKAIDNVGRVTDGIAIRGGNGAGIQDIRIYTGEALATTERLRIDNVGNVGIARTTNSYQLDTSGTPSITGTGTEYDLSINRECFNSTNTAYLGFNKTLNVDNQYAVSTFRAPNINRNSTSGWMDIAKFVAWDIDAKVIIQAGGTFTGDQVEVRVISSYNSALNNGRSGPYLEVKSTQAHTGDRFTKVRIGCHNSNRHPILQVYLDGSKTHNAVGTINVTCHDYGSNYGGYADRGEARFQSGTTLNETWKELHIVDGTHQNGFMMSHKQAIVFESPYVKKPEQVAWSMHSSNGQTNFNTGDKVTFNQAGTGFGSAFNTARNHGGVSTSAHSFTAPVTGLYLTIVTMFFYSDNMSNICSIVPRINNSQLHNGNDTIFYFAVQGSDEEITRSGSLMLQLTKGDELTVHRRTGGTGTHKYYGAHSQFQGCLIG